MGRNCLRNFREPKQVPWLLKSSLLCEWWWKALSQGQQESWWKATLRGLWEGGDLQDARLHYREVDDFVNCHRLCNISCDSCMSINKKVCKCLQESMVLNINQLINHAKYRLGSWSNHKNNLWNESIAYAIYIMKLCIY